MKVVYKTDAKTTWKGWKVRPLEEKHSVSREEEAGGPLSRPPGMCRAGPPLPFIEQKVRAMEATYHMTDWKVTNQVNC